jgi:hypothetical protein
MDSFSRNLETLSPELERALGVEDPAISALSESERAVIGAAWLHRAESEMTAAVAFTDLARDLFAEQAAASVRWLVVRAATDEMRHSELCRRVATLYCGAEQRLPEPRRYEPPRFGDCPEPLNRTLRVVVQSSMSETVGSVALKRLLDESVSTVVRRSLHELLRDEIDHARIGYAHLSSGYVSADHREHVRRAIPTLLDFTRAAWLAADVSAPSSVPPGHGALAQAAIVEVLDDAIENLVRPGLEQVLRETASS